MGFNQQFLFVCCGRVTQSENVYYFLIGPLLDILILVSLLLVLLFSFFLGWN